MTPQQGAQAVGSVTLAPNGNLWASVGWNLYNSGTVLRRVSLRPDPQPERLTWSDTNLRFVGSRLYVTIGTAVYSVDTATLHVDQVVADGVSTQTTDVLSRRLYYPSGTSIREVTPSAATVETTAKSPYRLDRCGTGNDRYVIPYEPGVSYYVDGPRKSTGNYATGGRLSVTVKATAQDGWSLTGKTSWALELTDARAAEVVAGSPHHDC
ncbi:hypothetical protein [Serinicoccus marinus]|uniref:hypothetical protein n=1 Tax=Serinicoccus marinus TaxID=247333 RepID=UPI002491173E|nr:hypothetical protein [Serinicoccus marinus]